MSTNHKSKLTKSQQKKLREFIERAEKVQLPKVKRGGEVSDFHPLVANWLTEQGYDHQHHVRLEDFGVVDFLATHKDGHKLLVEAKYGHADIRKAILQVRVYQSQMPDAQAVVIAPTPTIRDGDIKAAEKHGVKIIAIELPEETPVENKLVNILLYQCPDCGQYLYSDYKPVGMEILEKEGCRVSVFMLESARKGEKVEQPQPAPKKRVKKEPKLVHAWPPLPGEKKKYSGIS